MLKIRVQYDDNRDLAEVIRLLSPRLNYCRKYPGYEPKRCYLGIETDDLYADLVSQKCDEVSKLAEIPKDTPIEISEGGEADECDQRL